MILIRHAQSEWNRHFSETRIDPGIPDPLLTELGRQQAEALIDQLSTYALSALIASPYRRTLETAEIVASALNLPISVNPLVRERCAVIQDELMNRQSEKMNKNMYLLAIVAAVMLPLGFVTGLLGINVDGMPGASNTPWAFGAVSIALIIVGAIEVWLLRRLRWF